MRGALIGCGFFAQNHLNAWRDMRAEGIELVAVCDADEGKAGAAASEFQVPKVYNDAASSWTVKNQTSLMLLRGWTAIVRWWR
jgi:predicted dehydrogenase